MENPAVKLCLLIQKYIYTPETLTEKLDSFFGPAIVYLTTEEGLRFLESVCRYIFMATTIDHAAILRKVTMLPDGAKEAIMTTAEKLIKQGLEKGLEEGEQRGEKKAKIEYARRMIEEGLEEDLIIRITGLSRDEVRALVHR